MSNGLLSPKTLGDIINTIPTERDFAVIGKVVLQHTGLENLLENLVWLYMKSIDRGHIATSQLGIQQLTDMLQTLVDWTEPEDAVAEAIEWGVAAFHILRLNRNSVVHGVNFKADKKADKLFIERKTKSLVFDSFEIFEINHAVLAKITEDQNALANYFYILLGALKARGPSWIGSGIEPPTSPLPLPSKPPEPKRLIPLPHESPLAPRRQRQASEATAAKQAKLDRKDRQRRHQRLRDGKPEPA